MDYTTDDMPAGLKIVEHPPGSFAWMLQKEEGGATVQVDGRDGYGSWEEAMAAARQVLGLGASNRPSGGS